VPEQSIYSIKNHDATNSELWDKLVEESATGTFLHSRKFLSYHGNRFEDCSLEFWRADRLVGLLPLARSKQSPEILVSHPGSTFGGLIQDGTIQPIEFMALLKDIGSVCMESFNCRKLQYKAVPHIYHKTPDETDIYAFFRLAVSVKRVDLSATIDLEQEKDMSQRRLRCLRNAKRNNIEESSCADRLEEFWELLIANLMSRHGVQPVHSVEEITKLAKRFPENIEFTFAIQQNRVAAGMVNFHHKTVTHAQYMGSNELGKKSGALDMLVANVIGRSRSQGLRYFDFGISTEHQGLYLNQGLHRFKSEFGGGSTIYQMFEIDLERLVLHS